MYVPIILFLCFLVLNFKLAWHLTPLWWRLWPRGPTKGPRAKSWPSCPHTGRTARYVNLLRVGIVLTSVEELFLPNLGIMDNYVTEPVAGYGTGQGPGDGTGAGTGPVRDSQLALVLGERGRPRAGRAVAGHQNRLDCAASQHEVHPLPC